MNPSKTIARFRRWPALAVLAFALGLPPAVRAFVFDVPGAKASFDTTISFGGAYRLGDPDPDLYGLTSTSSGIPGKQRSVNADDGNLNYQSGFSSVLAKASHDLSIAYPKGGIFVRGYYFYDFINGEKGGLDRTALSPEARRIVGTGGEFLDAYAYINPTLGDMPTSLRVGQQVLSWGESTFIPNGINSINPIDVAKLRVPGAELKEALLPVNMVSGSISLTENLTFEAFYLLDWKETRIDPPGTYFSSNDFVARGGSKVFLGFGAIPDSSSLGGIPRGVDNEARDLGQFGVNLRYLAAGLKDTEFGLYCLNYHSRLPLISAQTPTAPVNTALVLSDSAAILGSNTAYTTALALALGNPAAVPAAMATLIGATLTGVPASALPAVLQPFYAPTAAVTGPVSQRELLVAAGTGRYLIEYPEDIHLFGGSFSTNLWGTAFQGELSYRNNQPLQVDDVELLFAALSPLSSRFGNSNQIGTFPLNTYIPGYRRVKVWTGQLTATKLTRGILGADQTTLVGEIGFVHADLPAKGTLRFDGPGTFVGGDLASMNNSGSNASGVPPLSEPAEAFADPFSAGYQLLARLDYNNLFAGINVSPLVVFAHDIGGNTPLPMGNFLHGRMTFTLGADFTFQNAWAFELRYVNYSGGHRYNLLADRDYVSATLKYSF